MSSYKFNVYFYYFFETARIEKCQLSSICSPRVPSKYFKYVGNSVFCVYRHVVYRWQCCRYILLSCFSRKVPDWLDRQVSFKLNNFLKRFLKLSLTFRSKSCPECRADCTQEETRRLYEEYSFDSIFVFLYFLNIF